MDGWIHTHNIDIDTVDTVDTVDTEYRERNGLTLCVKLLGFAEEMEEDLAGLDQKVGCSVLD